MRACSLGCVDAIELLWAGIFVINHLLGKGLFYTAVSFLTIVLFVNLLYIVIHMSAAIVWLLLHDPLVGTLNILM